MKLQIITDEPTLDDALDFGNYSNRLAEIITNSTPRFSIGVFGGWGTGKTSLMSMIKQILDGNDKIVTVWFDAWRYEREEYLAVIPFLRTVKLSLDAVQKFKAGNWKNVKKGVIKAANVFGAITTVTPVPGISFNFGKAADILKGDDSIGGNKNNIYYHATDFLERALSELRDSDKDYRIVVFIDDLDRCRPEKALEVLESVKSFFDVEGIVYVIGMDSKTINSLVRKKYGEASAVEGLDYLQKIVQLPFQIPSWRETDILTAISKIISKGLEGSNLVNEFENQKKLIVKAVQLNPREVKRFVNNIILAKAVFGKPLDELVVVQALKFRSEWNKFLELITPDKKRKRFLSLYKKLERQGQAINTKEELEEKIKSNSAEFKAINDIYQELVKQNNEDLKDFLEAGAIEILTRIEEMEEHIRALDTTKPIEKEFKYPSEISTESLLRLLREGNVVKFNEIRRLVPKFNIDFSVTDLSDVNLYGANLSGANLLAANLVGANLLDADLSDSDLTNALLKRANLSRANLSHANLSHADLTDANLTDAILSSSRMSDIESYEGMTCKDCNLQEAIIDNEDLLDFFRTNMAKNVPPGAVRNE